MICAIQSSGIPVALCMIYCSCAVIGNQHWCNTTEKLKHLDVCFNPIVCLFIHVCLYKCILAVGQNSYKNPCFCDLAGIRINDVGRISRPVNFGLFTGFSLDMHGCSALFLILLDVIAELGIHERFFSVHAAFLTVFHPEEFFVDSVP